MVTFIYRKILSEQTDKWAVCDGFKVGVRNVCMKSPRIKCQACERNDPEYSVGKDIEGGSLLNLLEPEFYI